MFKSSLFVAGVLNVAAALSACRAEPPAGLFERFEGQSAVPADVLRRALAAPGVPVEAGEACWVVERADDLPAVFASSEAVLVQVVDGWALLYVD